MGSSSNPNIAMWESWRDALGEYKSMCPYVGPRPQGEDDQDMLIGRESELVRLARAVLDRQVVVVDGYSGSGKTSLIDNGLIAQLKRQGFAVFRNNNWAGLEERNEVSDIDDFIAAAIGLRDEAGALKSGRGLCGYLDETYGHGAVLVLDQFEEALRQEDGGKDALIGKWISTSTYSHRTHLVISLRTDSIHRLQPLLRGLRPYSSDRIRIEDLCEEKDIKSLFSTARKTCRYRAVFTNDARDGLWDLWREKRPSLLNTQACLFALFFRALKDASDRTVTIDSTHLAAFKNEADGKQQPFFSYALREAIGFKVAHARDAAKGMLDDYLVVGALEAVKRIAPLLSSGDHKVPIRGADLVFRVLDDELRVMATALETENPTEGKPLPRRTFQATLLASMLRQSSPGGPKDKKAAARDVTSGPMMGQAATDALRHEVNRVAFAIEWLRETALLRGDKEGILQLIHDKVGAALNDWADAAERDPSAAIRRLTGARGERFDWGDKPLEGMKGAPLILVNLNWRECRIQATVRHVIFLNCDFTASKFESCTFEGVIFLNCVLDDANFEHCIIEGSASLELPDRPMVAGKKGVISIPPSFKVYAPDEVKNFVPYLHPGIEVGHFFSDTVGQPALPGDDAPGDFRGELLASFTPSPMKAFEVSPMDGGLAIVGGRVCFLTIFRCTATRRDVASLVLHHVAGNGLDLVEHEGIVAIRGAAIRGISVSRDGDASSKRVCLEVDKSIAVNLCFSQGLDGKASFSNSTVMMLINANGQKEEGDSQRGFEVQLVNCRSQFIVNADMNDDSIEISKLSPSDNARYFIPVPGTHSRFTVDHLDEFARTLEGMDFRSRPDVWNMKLRADEIQDARQSPNR